MARLSGRHDGLSAGVPRRLHPGLSAGDTGTHRDPHEHPDAHRGLDLAGERRWIELHRRGGEPLGRGHPVFGRDRGGPRGLGDQRDHRRYPLPERALWQPLHLYLPCPGGFLPGDLEVRRDLQRHHGGGAEGLQRFHQRDPGPEQFRHLRGGRVQHRRRQGLQQCRAFGGDDHHPVGAFQRG